MGAIAALAGGASVNDGETPMKKIGLALIAVFACAAAVPPGSAGAGS